MSGVRYEHVTKVFDDGTRAVSELELSIEQGEFLVLVGPSGCGKTTALRMLAGLENVTEGSVWIGDRVVNDLEPRERDVAMVFQNYALYPNMTVRENIGFALKLRRVPKKEIDARVQGISRVLGISELLDRKPRALSGGQRQRVAMGRAIIRDPAVFLMDEPLSNLDAKLRVQMRSEIARIQHEIGATTLYVTHDQVEAMTMGDRVGIMRKGFLQQLDHPQALYTTPVDLFVATFIGSPSMNLIRCVLDRDADGYACCVGEQRLPLPPEVTNLRPRLASFVGREIALGVRPEHLEDAAFAPERPRLHGLVQATESLGSALLVYVEIGAPPVATQEVREAAADVDDVYAAELTRAESATVVGSFDSGSTAARGERIEMAVDARRLHFFDLETERAILPEPALVVA